MEISSYTSLVINVPLNPAPTSRDATARSVVAAVQSLNSSQMLGQDRSLIYRQDPKTGHQVIEIVDQGSGDVVDQIPAEVLLRRDSIVNCSK